MIEHPHGIKLVHVKLNENDSDEINKLKEAEIIKLNEDATALTSGDIVIPLDIDSEEE